MYFVWPVVVPVQRMFLCFKLTATNEPIASLVGIKARRYPIWLHGIMT